MLKFIGNHAERDDDFFEKYIDTSQYKLLFSNGLYDMRTNTFTKGFDPSVVFRYRIDRPFRRYDTLELCEIKHKVHKIRFEDPYDPEDAPTVAYLKKGLARGIAGDYMAKRALFLIGLGDSGKGVTAEALIKSLGGYVSAFNAKGLLYNKNSGADSAKQLSWVIPIAYKRLAIASECTRAKEQPMDGNAYKSFVSGGDPTTARANFQDEKTFKIRCTPLFCLNDIIRIQPYDSGVEQRTDLIEQCYGIV